MSAQHSTPAQTRKLGISVHEKARQLRRNEMAAIFGQIVCALILTFRRFRRHFSAS